MAKDHGSSVKNDKQYEGLRKKGMSKSRAAAIANSEGASSRGGKKSGSSSSSTKSNSKQGGTTQQKKAAGRKGGKATAKKPSPVRRLRGPVLKRGPAGPDEDGMEWHLPGVIAPSNRTPPPRFVTDVVLDLGLAGHDDVNAAVDAARATGARPEAVLLQNGVLDDERLAHALAERYGLDRLDLDHFPLDGGAAALVSVDTALRHEALPVASLDGGRLLVAVADPAAGPAATAIARATGREVVPALAPRHRLRGLIEATANRGPVPLPAVPAAAPTPPEPAAAAPEDGYRVAELE